MSGIISDNQGRSSGLVKAAAAGGGAWNLIKTLTSDGSDADLSFVNGASDVVLDGTYITYCFVFVNIHIETADQHFGFNGSIDGGSNYNVTKTTSLFRANHSEAASSNLTYDTAFDIASGTGFANIMTYMEAASADATGSGMLYLYNPASTTYMKNWHYINTHEQVSDVLYHFLGSGYFNTTSAINAIQFKCSSGEIQGGKISLYGIST